MFKKFNFENILNKIILVLFGIFILATIFALMINLFDTFGIYLGIILTGGLIFCGFYYIKQNTKLRFLTWVLLIALISFIIIYFIGLQMISNLLKDF